MLHRCSYRWSTRVLTLLSTVLNPTVIRRAELAFLTSVGSVAAKSKRKKKKETSKRDKLDSECNFTMLSSMDLLSHGNAFGRSLCTEGNAAH